MICTYKYVGAYNETLTESSQEGQSRCNCSSVAVMLSRDDKFAHLWKLGSIEKARR